MNTVKVVLWKYRNKTNGLFPVYLRITQDRKSKYLSLKLYIDEKDWDGNSEKVKKTHPNAQWVNAYITKRKLDSQEAALKGEILGKFEEETCSGKLKSIDFFQFAEIYLRKVNRTGEVSSYTRTKAILSKLKAYRPGTLKFEQITIGFLKTYEDYLRDKLDNSTNTIHSNLKVIRRILNEAVLDGLLEQEQNPFPKYKLKTEKTCRTYLTEEEFFRLQELTLPDGSLLFHHQQAFLFATYACGLRVSDVLLMRWKNFDGKRLHLKIKKTSKAISFKVSQKALEILSYYKKKSTNSTGQEDLVFPLLKLKDPGADKKMTYNAISSGTALANKSLKKLAQMADINKKLSFHASRHTWATRALRNGMRIEYVSKLLGHGSIKETEVYAHIVNNELDKAIELLDASLEQFS